MIDFTVKGNPKPQPRHRHVNRGKFTSTYDPAKKDKASFARMCLREAPIDPIEEATRVELVFAFARPKSHMGTGRNANKVKPSAPEKHTKKPDIDNLQKYVFDALNGLFWKDDSVIDEVIATKKWAPEGYTRITVTEPEDYLGEL